MTDPGEEAAEETKPRQNPWLLAAAAALIAVPVLVGFVMLRNNSNDIPADVVGGTTTPGGGMGGNTSGGSGGDRQAAGVGDFAEIQANEIKLDFDPDTGSAILMVDTSIGVACAVTYGPTTGLGSLSTDTDMAGGAHANHHPKLIGLTAGPVWYRVQAIAPDGKLYQSELLQFDFPEGSGGVPAVQPPLPNVASRARVSEVSSEYSDAYGAANAIDGDLATEWSSAGDGDAAYIVLDFGENMRVRGVGFRTRQMTDGTSITNTFTVTVGGKTYGPFEAGPGLAIGLFDASGQTVRIDVDTSTGGNTGAVEIEVYAEPEM